MLKSSFFCGAPVTTGQREILTHRAVMLSVEKRVLGARERGSAVAQISWELPIRWNFQVQNWVPSYIQFHIIYLFGSSTDSKEICTTSLLAQQAAATFPYGFSPFQLEWFLEYMSPLEGNHTCASFRKITRKLEFIRGIHSVRKDN